MSARGIKGVGGESVGQDLEKRRSRSNFGREQATSAGN
jgi:hypothetical protein